MRNLRLLLEYDGTDYHGFQKQPRLRTVQSELEAAIGKVVDAPIRLIGAGRTDAGVHATGQVANFLTDNRIPIERLPAALNSLLPTDVAVKEAEEVPLDFHARRWAVSRCYQYLLLNQPWRSALLARYSHWVPGELAVGKMNEAARCFLGEHDFRSFQASGSTTRHTVRRVSRAAIRRMGRLVVITLEANAFLYQMVRIMVGTLLSVGLGKRPPEGVKAILESADRRQAGKTVPAKGLCLVRVNYQEDRDADEDEPYC